MFLKRYRKTLPLGKVTALIKQQETFDAESVDLLVMLGDSIRPMLGYKVEKAEERIRTLIGMLKTDAVFLLKFQDLIKAVFAKPEIAEILTNSGIIEESGFFSELNRRINHKILPPLKEKGSFLAVINAVFYRRNDYVWVQEVSNSYWIELFECIEVELNLNDAKTRQHICQSLITISYYISSLSLQKNIKQYHNLSIAESPFIEQSKLAQQLTAEINGGNITKETKSLLSKSLYRCEEAISGMRRQSIARGTSVRLTHILMQLSLYINRMLLMLTLLEDEENVNYQRIVNQFKYIVESENTKNGILNYLAESMQFLAYRIAEHERNTGEHYITTSKGEYKSMLKSAMKGGFIISFIVIIKSLLHFIRFAPFWQGFAYSINYAFGFILIHTTGSTLATKQPAMTASAIASSIDRKNRHIDLPKLAILVSKVVRSQTASFAGNLLIVFPLTLAIAFLVDFLFGFKFADGKLAQSMLDAQNPLKSLCLLYACFTGVFLFLSGIISGYFDNLVLFQKIPQRIQDHPWLKKHISTKRREKIAAYIQKNLGALMGNLTLGFFLGMASFFGAIFGIPFDIRHITISTGYYALGLYGLSFNVPLSGIIFTGIGVLSIGFLNFLVSFSLAFWVALSSRKIKFNKYKSLGKYLFRLFIKHPKDFIFPPTKPRTPQDFIATEPKTDEL